MQPTYENLEPWEGTLAAATDYPEVFPATTVPIDLAGKTWRSSLLVTLIEEQRILALPTAIVRSIVFFVVQFDIGKLPERAFQYYCLELK